jgi:hypothetical protein
LQLIEKDGGKGDHGEKKKKKYRDDDGEFGGGRTTIGGSRVGFDRRRTVIV